MATRKPGNRSDNSGSEDSGKRSTGKGRVLHTRVPEVLEQELKAAARNLRIPVSNLVRTILEDAIAATVVVGKVAEDELLSAAGRIHTQRDRWSHAAARAGRAAASRSTDAQSEAQAEPADAETSSSTDHIDEPGAQAPVDPLSGVIGYQPLVLAVETQCSKCNQTLTPGSSAFLGVHSEPGVRVIIGPECVPGGSTS